MHLIASGSYHELGEPSLPHTMSQISIPICVLYDSQNSNWLFPNTELVEIISPHIRWSPKITIYSLPWSMSPQWTSIRLHIARTIVWHSVLWHSRRTLHATTSHTGRRHLLPVGHFACVIELNVTLMKLVHNPLRIGQIISLLQYNFVNLILVNTEHSLIQTKWNSPV